MRKTILVAVVALCLCLARTAPAWAVDSNLHTLKGALNSCDCVYYPTSNDWLCHANLTVGAPLPHFTPSEPTILRVEIVGQAIGECGALIPLLPRTAQASFWLEAAGIDYIHSVIRSPVRVYHIIDLGALQTDGNAH